MAVDPVEPQSRPTEPAAIVLTGGRSTRMGADKATLVVDGEAMVDRVLRAVAEAAITRVVIAGPGQVADVDPDQGPMAGIVAGWSALRRTPGSNRAGRPHLTGWDPVAVLACDLPRLDDEVVRSLVHAARGHRHGAVAHDGTRRQPLVAAYRADALDEIEFAYRAGERSVRRLLEGWALGELRVESGTIADADAPDDLRGFDVKWPS